MWKKVKPEERQYILDHPEEKAKAIAKKLGLSHQTVYNIREQEGLKPLKINHGLDARNIKDVTKTDKAMQIVADINYLKSIVKPGMTIKTRDREYKTNNRDYLIKGKVYKVEAAYSSFVTVNKNGFISCIQWSDIGGVVKEKI